jgi:uncharacterized protein YsxB (DUF464 family)
MIHVKFEFDDQRGSMTLRVKGHADQAVYGQDIVCAAASILSTTLAQSLKVDRTADRLRREPRIKFPKPGDALITAFPKEEYKQIVLTEFLMAKSGFLLLAYNYPQYVMLEEDDITPQG